MKLKIKSDKIGRNDPCPCGSGLKYKKCCLGKNGSPDRDLEAIYAEKYGIRLKKEKDIELNQLLGPVFLFGSSDYMVEFNDEPIYLRINLDFQLENLAMLDEVREKSPRIHNIVREVITNKSVNEFKARAGMQTARRLMLESINRD